MIPPKDAENRKPDSPTPATEKNLDSKAWTPKPFGSSKILVSNYLDSCAYCYNPAVT